MGNLLQFLNKDFNNGKDLGLLILRVVAGFLLIYGHGWGKVSKILSGAEIQFLDPIGLGPTLSFYLAAFAEGLCAFLLILGLFSRAASLILVFNFIVIFYFHKFVQGEGFSDVELVSFYLFTFITLTLTGPGKYALDHYLTKKVN